MKKLLFLTIALMMFASCQKGDESNDDNSTLVSGIIMPTKEFKTNDSVTIKGKGFLKGDAISLRAAVKSSDISAVVTEVTESQLVFIVPRGVVAGKMNVVLKRDVREQILGEVTIASRPPAKIYGLSVTPTDLYEIDPLNLLDDKYQIESQLVSVANPSSMFTYDAVEDMMYVYVSNGWCSVDLKTTPATSNTVKGALQPIRELFVVR